MQLPPPTIWASTIEVGCFYALIAVAYLIILQGAGFFNFAIGPYAIVASMGASWAVVNFNWSPPLAIGSGLLTAVVLGMLTELLVVRPIDARAPGQELPALVAVVAVLFALEQGAGSLYGRLPLPGVPWIDGDSVTLGTLHVDRAAILLVVLTLVIFVALSLWTRYARYGQMLRAVGDNRHAAELLGLPVNRIRLVAFGLAALVAGIGGSLWAFKAGVRFDAGLDYALDGFLTLVIAGTGVLWAPLVAGLLFAALQQLSTYYVGGAAIHYVTLLLAVVFFAVRPGGLFVRRARI
jgi:branched-chain amino acid transport system permease protein